MRTVCKTVYQFSELSQEAKDKAVQNLYDINVDFDGWREFIYEDFCTICDNFGITINQRGKTGKAMYFSGFSHQGSFSAFECSVDVKEFIKCVQSKKILEYAPNIEESFKIPIIQNAGRILNLLNTRLIDFSISTECVRDYMRKHSEFNTYDANCSTPRVDDMCQELCDDIENFLGELNHYLYKTLEKEYEYLTSEAVIIETIEANEYEFDEDGTLA